MSFRYFNFLIMGKGDIKTKKGKRHIGSFGKHRVHKKKREEGKKSDKKTEA
jgi:ribosomal small subunit protein bTHX